MNEVGEDNNGEGLLSLSDDEVVISNRIEEEILPLSQDSNSNRNRIEEIDWELNELEIEEEVEDEVDRNVGGSGITYYDMIDVESDEEEEQEDEVILIEEEQDDSQYSIAAPNSYSYDSQGQSQAEEDEDEEDWNICTQDNQVPSISSHSTISRISTPEKANLQNRSNFSTPSNSSRALEEISQSFCYNSPLIPSFSTVTESSNNSSLVPRRSSLIGSQNALLPLSTDRTNLFESQESEEEQAMIMDIKEEDDDVYSIKGGSLPLLPRRLFSSDITTSSSHTNLKRASSFNSISKVQSEVDLLPFRKTGEPHQPSSNDRPVESSSNKSTKAKKSRKKLKLSEEPSLTSSSSTLSHTSTKDVVLAPPLASPPKALERIIDPMQAEMDAFFGFLDPHRSTSTPSPPAANFTPTSVPTKSVVVRSKSKQDSDREKENSQIIPNTRFSKEEKGKGKELVIASGSDSNSGKEMEIVAENQRKKSDEPYYQLQPIPTISTRTNLALTVNERRLAIINSLERLTLSILAQLIDSAIPPPPSPPLADSSTSFIDPATLDPGGIVSPSTQDPLSLSQSQSQSQSQSSLSQSKSKSLRGGKPKVVATWKPSPVTVLLAKRVDGSSYDPNDGEIHKTRRLLFPRRNSGECGGPALARLLKVLELILDGLKRKVISTKRDIYYRSVKLFGNQARVDSLVEDIAATLRVRRSDLNIVAASKGLFGGFIKILGTDKIVREGGDQGCLIPPAQSIQSIEMVNVDWVLIIEKEAVFQSLCCPTFLEETENLGRGVLITGKGYPDVSTRELVHAISTLHPSIPLLCLVDSDPHGLEILSTYKFGSAALAFDNSNLAVSRVEWLGVKGTEWDEVGVDRDELLILSQTDRKKALGMLKRNWMPNEWKKELEYMLHLGRKAEIQVLSSAVASPPLLDGFLAELVYGESQPSQNNESEKAGKGSSLFEYVARKIIPRLA